MQVFIVTSHETDEYGDNHDNVQGIFLSEYDAETYRTEYLKVFGRRQHVSIDPVTVQESFTTIYI